MVSRWHQLTTDEITCPCRSDLSIKALSLFQHYLSDVGSVQKLAIHPFIMHSSLLLILPFPPQLSFPVQQRDQSSQRRVCKAHSPPKQNNCPKALENLHDTGKTCCSDTPVYLCDGKSLLLLLRLCPTLLLELRPGTPADSISHRRTQACTRRARAE